MLDQSGDTVTGQRPELKDVIERFAADSKRWMTAELRLAQLEAADMKNRMVRAALVTGVMFAAALCLLTALTQASIYFLTTVFASAGVAALVTAAILALVIGVCVLVLRNAMRLESESLLFRWFTARPQGVPQ